MPFDTNLTDDETEQVVDIRLEHDYPDPSPPSDGPEVAFDWTHTGDGPVSGTSLEIVGEVRANVPVMAPWVRWAVFESLMKTENEKELPLATQEQHLNPVNDHQPGDFDVRIATNILTDDPQQIEDNREEIEAMFQSAFDQLFDAVSELEETDD